MTPPQAHRPPADWPFLLLLGVVGGFYVALIVALLVADASFTTPGHLLGALKSPEIRYAVWLSLISCTITAILSLFVAVPLGYLLSRSDSLSESLLAALPEGGRGPARVALAVGRKVVDALLDVPIVLPPLVVGLSLLILFQTPPGRSVERFVPVTYAVPSVILAQFSVSAAFAVRTMRVAFDQITPRREQVALTLGCSRSQAFWWVVLPEAWRGVVTAATLAWARALGEFGPVLVFSGATRLRTEVLPTTVFLELSIGNLDGAVAVSLLMVAAALLVLVIVRLFGLGRAG